MERKMDFLCEYVVERKKEGLYRFKKSAIIALWIIGPLLFICICMGIGSINVNLIFFRWAVFLIPLFVWLGLKVGPITAAYGQEAFECSIASGTMTFSIIYGDRFRKEWFKVELAKAEKCAPLGGLNNPELDGGKFDHVYKAVSSMSAPYVYYIIYKDEQDKRCVAYFEVIKKSLRMIKTYYPATVMMNLPE